MPDDEKDQVTEPEEDEDDFSAVFAEEDEKEDASNEPEDPDEDEGEGKEEDSETSEEADSKESESSEEEAEEEDDLITRGKEILEAEEKQKKEQEEAAKKAEEEEARKKAETEASNVNPINHSDVENLMGIIDKNEIPDQDFDVNGIQVNPREFIDDNPESLVVGGLMAAKTVQRMVKSGALVSGQSMEQAIKQTADRIWGDTFGVIVSMWHEDAEDLVQSKEYTGWLDEQKDEIKALVKTGNPIDYKNVINRYKVDQISKEDDGKKKETEDEGKKKAAEKKKKVDKLMKKSKAKKRPAPTIPELDSMGNVDEGFAEGFNEEGKK